MREFEKNIMSIYGELGKVWLQKLLEITRDIAVRYSLSALRPVENLSYHYVMSGFQGDQPIILKLGLDIDNLKRETAALHAFAGSGGVRVLEQEDGVLLLERAIPGKSLKKYFPVYDNEAIRIVCDVVKQLHQAPLSSKCNFPHIKDWLSNLDKDWDIPPYYLMKARKLRDKLLATSMQGVLLHGDLHHDNILQNDQSWVVIDPKGVIGESAYEVAAFIRNPLVALLKSNEISSIIAKRINRFAEILSLPQSRLLDWSFVQSVLAWTWALEDNGDVAHFRKLTDIFAETMN